MRISKLVAAGMVLAAIATSANALDITLTKDGGSIDTSTVPTVYYVGKASPSDGPYYGGLGATAGTIAPEYLTSGFSGGDQIQLSFSDSTQTNLNPVGGNGTVLKWNGSGFTNVSGTVFADAQMMDPSNNDTNPMTSNPTPTFADVALATGPSQIFPSGSPLAGSGETFQLFLESNVSATPVTPADGIYLVLLRPTLVGGSAFSLPFGLLAALGDEDVTGSQITAATNFADSFITPEPASFALLTIGSVLMLRRNRRVA